MTCYLFGALAGFERDLIHKRTLAGLAAARTRGRKGGRPAGAEWWQACACRAPTRKILPGLGDRACPPPYNDE
jgi:DNA invertase Pin-like site-specific DNA recombinase